MGALQQTKGERGGQKYLRILGGIDAADTKDDQWVRNISWGGEKKATKPNYISD